MLDVYRLKYEQDISPAFEEFIEYQRYGRILYITFLTFTFHRDITDADVKHCDIMERTCELGF